MRKSYLIGLTTALLGLAAIAADTAPALAGQAAWPQVTQVQIFGGQETFTQTACGGDFGMLGNVEAAQVAQANPTNAPVCE
jgi:hypothetical protein